MKFLNLTNGNLAFPKFVKYFDKGTQSAASHTVHFTLPSLPSHAPSLKRSLLNL